MKKQILSYLFFFVLTIVQGQKQASLWYFGNKAGLDFNHLPPLPLLNGDMNAPEGCATISDHNGKLLFYTNGQRITSRRHTLMKNGDNILGDLSSTDNAIAVPAPDNDSIYYLFTIGAAYRPNKGFRYSVINMKRDDGFGEVVDKNVLLQPSAFEKIAAVKHCNKKDVWIVVHKFDSDEYEAYLLTATGVLPPVISHTGFFIDGEESNSIGTLKFSPNNKMLAALHTYQNNLVELMQFDNVTGIISSPIIFKPDPGVTPPSFTGVYGAEFSPNGRLLYISDNTSPDDRGFLYQFDISSGNPASILASKQTLTIPDPYFVGALQMGIDNKIYVTMLNDTSISVIENPDVYGPGCNFNYNKIFLGASSASPLKMGLPKFVQSYFDEASNPYEFSRSGNCFDKDVAFTINRLAGIDSVKWDFGDGQKSTLLAPVNHYATSGEYLVNLIVYKTDCSGQNDTIDHVIWISVTKDLLGSDKLSCALSSTEIGIDPIPDAGYLWNTGAAENKIIPSAYGKYWIMVDQNGCTISDTINILQHPVPVVNLGIDTTICASKAITLTAGIIQPATYLWSTGEITRQITVTKAGQYSVKVTANCDVFDTINITKGDCAVFVPNTFTPNGDEINKEFGVLGDFFAKDFSMTVFDRWGNVIFRSNSVTQRWDGKHKGKVLPDGNYPWIISYINGMGYTKRLKGYVLMLH